VFHVAGISMDRRTSLRLAVTVALFAAAGVGLYVAEQTSYLLYHALAELFSIAVAVSIFLIVWNARRFIDSGYLLLVGVAYLFVAVTDLVHTLAYKGMGVFDTGGSNLATQLWIGARYMEAGSLLLAFAFMRRKPNVPLAVGGYAAVTALLLLSIFHWDIFPTCYDDVAGGLTPFKKTSEYVIAGMCVGGIALLHAFRRQFARPVLWLLTGSLAITAGSEAVFTLYKDPYGPANLIGHLLKVLSFYLIYRALVGTALVDPYGLLWRNLKQSEQSLQRARWGLEQRVRERTADLEDTVDALQGEVTERREAERRLRESQQFIQNITDYSPAFIFVYDVVEQTNVYVNRSFEEFFGVSGEQIRHMGRRFFEERMDPEARAQIDVQPERFAGVADGEVSENEFRMKNARGEYRWLHTYETVLERDEQGRVRRTLGTVFDVTDRREAELELETARVYAESIVDTVHEPLLVLDGDLLVRSANPAFYDLFRVAPGETEGRPLRELGNGQWDIPDLRELLEEIIPRSRQVADFEVRHDFPAIGRRVMLLNARRIDRGEDQPALILLAVRDVTEQRRAQEIARAERERLFGLLNMLPGYVALKGRDYHIRFANRAFRDVFGEPDGRACYEIQFDRDSPCPGCQLPEVLSTRELSDWERTYPDGQSWHVWAYPFTDPDGTDVLLELGINVTERKRLEREVVETGEAQRRRIGRDLHDSLGQNLTGLGFLFHGLAAKLAEPSPADAETVRQIDGLINKCVAEVRGLARGLDPVGLHEDGIAAGLRELAGNTEAYFGVPCELHCDGPVDVGTDSRATQLYHIAREAVNNAAKHAAASKIDVYLDDADDEVVLRVTDDGKGLPEGARKSDGMGLRVMDHRAASIGATLSIDSDPDGGTVVTCILPKGPRRG
jgi:PAS domain S-box-containing protein